ncbi:MAG: tyrosine-type recombinase/integrase [Candidatus Gracilibacteria bacterium]|nr:tyrosine-type recombinase/integrase [Candidatus Gracilibacteria bacterium]
MNFVRAIDEFLVYIRIHKNLSLKTVEQYERHLIKFLWYLVPEISEFKGKPINHELIFLESPEDSIKRSEKDILKRFLLDNCHLELENVKISDLNEFRLHIAEKGLSVKTANAYMITFRAFLKFCRKQGYESIDPVSIDLIKQKDREVTFLDTAEIVRIFNEIDTSTIQGKRDAAIIECIYSTGLRISELTALNKTAINLDTHEFSVRGKGSKIRTVYLTDLAVDKIQTYLEARKSELGEKDTFNSLFIRHNFSTDNVYSKSVQGNDVIKRPLTDVDVRLTRFFITNKIKEYALRANIIKEVSAHTLRHSFATTLLTNGADIRAIQELLGHASITTTQVYTHITNPKLKEIHGKFHR